MGETKIELSWVLTDAVVHPVLVTVQLKSDSERS